MIEIELKYALADVENLLAALFARGAVPAGETREVDVYFAHPVRDFSVTDEALRLRWDGKSATMTYKGPLLDKISKSREECELELPAGDAGLTTATRMLHQLGFRRVRTVEKIRSKLVLDDDGRTVTVSLDDVTGVGQFVELETLAAEEDWGAARDALCVLGERLGLGVSERRSYLQLLIERSPAAD